jgi:hypothetical protein
MDTADTWTLQISNNVEINPHMEYRQPFRAKIELEPFFIMSSFGVGGDDKDK